MGMHAEMTVAGCVFRCFMFSYFIFHVSRFVFHVLSPRTRPAGGLENLKNGMLRSRGGTPALLGLAIVRLSDVDVRTQSIHEVAK
jgi:hypothetical protein